MRCDACVLVVTPDDAVARWAAEPVALGAPGCTFRPLVVGPRAVPRVRDPDEARRLPELAVLSALAHGNEPRGIEVVTAVFAALGNLDDDASGMYLDVVHARLSEAARRALEEHMKIGGVQYEPQSPLFRKWFHEGKAEGKAEGEARGEAKGRAESILAILAARAIPVPGDVRRRIVACADIETLDRYIARAVVAASAEEVVAES
jgi:hypothetical protein